MKKLIVFLFRLIHTTFRLQNTIALRNLMLMTAKSCAESLLLLLHHHHHHHQWSTATAMMLLEPPQPFPSHSAQSVAAPRAQPILCKRVSRPKRWYKNLQASRFLSSMRYNGLPSSRSLAFAACRRANDRGTRASSHAAHPAGFACE